MAAKPKNRIEIYCWFEDDLTKKKDSYEMRLIIGGTEFSTEGRDFVGKSSVMRAANRISKATGFPVVEVV